MTKVRDCDCGHFTGCRADLTDALVIRKVNGEWPQEVISFLWKRLDDYFNQVGTVNDILDALAVREGAE